MITLWRASLTKSGDSVSSSSSLVRFCNFESSIPMRLHRRWLRSFFADWKDSCGWRWWFRGQSRRGRCVSAWLLLWLFDSLVQISKLPLLNGFHFSVVVLSCHFCDLLACCVVCICIWSLTSRRVVQFDGVISWGNSFLSWNERNCENLVADSVVFVIWSSLW